MLNLTNFRDLGGIKTIDGRTLAPCRILRSGEPVSLTSADKTELMARYNLKTIIDLRGNHEVSAAPVTLPDRCEYVRIDVLESSDQNSASKMDFLKTITASSTELYMQELYKVFITNDVARKSIAKFIDVLLRQTNGSTLFHCFAGKDRTGICAAVILTILDVSEEDIFADYMLTNELRQEKNKQELAAVSALGLNEDQLNGFALALCVKREYLQASFLEAEKIYGTFMNYIKNGIGITDNDIKTLKQMYLI